MSMLYYLPISVLLTTTFSLLGMEKDLTKDKQLTGKAKIAVSRPIESFFLKKADNLFDIINSKSSAALRKRLQEADIQGGQRDYLGRTPLLLACEKQLPEMIEALVSDDRFHADVHGTDRNQNFPLLRAVESGLAASVRPLLALDWLDIEQTNQRGKTAFAVALERGLVEIIIAFLQTRKIVLTPKIIDRLLELCIESQELQIAWLSKFDVNTFDEKGNTLLIRTIKQIAQTKNAAMVAVRSQIIALLLQQEGIVVQPFSTNPGALAEFLHVKSWARNPDQFAQLEVRLRQLSLPYCKVLAMQDEQVQEEVLRMPEQDYETSELEVPVASKTDHVKTFFLSLAKEPVGKVLERLQKLHISYFSSNQIIDLLAMAIRREEDAILQALLRFPAVRTHIWKSKEAIGPERGSKNIPFEPPLMRACDKGYLMGVNLLVNACGDLLPPTAVNYVFRTLMETQADLATSYAGLCRHGGLFINSRDKKGKTPLILAICDHNNRSMEYVLSQPGADINASDCVGLTALMHAVEQNNSDAAIRICTPERRKLFNEKHIPLYVQHALKHASSQLIEFICAYFGYELTVVDFQHCASRSGDAQFKQWVLTKLGEIFKPKDLFLAFRFADTALFLLLLELPLVDLDVRNERREILLEVAIIKRRYDIVQLLGLLGARAPDETYIAGRAVYQEGLRQAKQMMSAPQWPIQTKPYLIALKDPAENSLLHLAIMAANVRMVSQLARVMKQREQFVNQQKEIASATALRLFAAAAESSIAVEQRYRDLLGKLSQQEKENLEQEKMAAFAFERRYVEILLILKNNGIVFLLRDLLKEYHQKNLMHFAVRHADLFQALLPLLSGYLKTKDANNIRPIDLIWQVFFNDPYNEVSAALLRYIH